MGLREELLDFDDTRTAKVKLPRWKKTLTVREMSLPESMALNKYIEKNSDGDQALTPEGIAQCVAFGVIDPKTEDRVFTDEDTLKLMKKHKGSLMLLFNKITEITGSVEDEVKN